jgi:hypothetical protein
VCPLLQEPVTDPTSTRRVADQRLAMASRTAGTSSCAQRFNVVSPTPKWKEYREILSSRGAWGTPCAALCSDTSIADSRAKRCVDTACAATALHGLHRATVSRSRETPIFDLGPNAKTLVGRPRPMHERRRPAFQMVAGVHDHRAPSGFKPDVTAGHRACTMEPPRRCTTQYRRFCVEVPRNPRLLPVLVRPPARCVSSSASLGRPHGAEADATTGVRRAPDGAHRRARGSAAGAARPRSR